MLYTVIFPMCARSVCSTVGDDDDRGGEGVFAYLLTPSAVADSGEAAFVAKA